MLIFNNYNTEEKSDAERTAAKLKRMRPPMLQGLRQQLRAADNQARSGHVETREIVIEKSLRKRAASAREGVQKHELAKDAREKEIRNQPVEQVEK